MSNRKSMTATYIKLGAVLFVVAAGVLFGLRFRHEKISNVVAIAQIVEHPSLDSERIAMTGVLEGAGLVVSYHNAQGNMSTAAQIAQQIVSSKPCAVIAISTPSAQTLMTLCKKNNIPFVYSAVTDPASAKLDGVTGVCDAVPADSPWKMVHHCQPDAKTVGMIYNAGEANSVHMVKLIMETAPSHDIAVEALAVHKVSDIAQAVQTLIARGVQAIYIPNDNMAVAAMSNIVAIAHPRGIPVYAGDEGSVQNGAVAAFAFNRRDLGKQAANIVLRTLGKIKDKESDEMPPLSFYVHPDAAKLFPNLNFGPINAYPSGSTPAQKNDTPRS